MDRIRLATVTALVLLLAGCAAVQAPTRAIPAAAPASSAPQPAFRADQDRIAGHLAALAAVADEHGGTRFAGTPGYEASVDYAAGELRSLGYEVATPLEPVGGGGRIGAGGGVCGAPACGAGRPCRRRRGSAAPRHEAQPARSPVSMRRYES